VKTSSIQRALALLVLCALAACQREQRAAGPMPHHVYVWQRVWNSGVRDGLRESSPAFGEIVVLTAQISLGRQRNITRVDPDYAALLGTGKAVGLAIRISPFPGPFSADDDHSRAIVGLVRERLAHARSSGLEPAELQIDFDCAESKLGGYRLWLKAIRAAVHPLPVCPTVLPTWLKTRSFADLARDSGRFVLQVHSVSPPKNAEDAQPLADPGRARVWAEEAGKLGVPFRVALPTYTYLAAFDQAGQPLGVSAEGPSSRWPSDARVVRWESEPADLAKLVASWTRERPAAMTGLIWYRMPVATDALNWRWLTLAAVMKGEVPRRQLRVEASGKELADLVVINDGLQDEPLPRFVDAHWLGTRLAMADALGGYVLGSGGGMTNWIRFQRTSGASLSRLRPGQRHPIGWIRCEPPVSIRLSIPRAADPVDGGQPAPPVRDGL
jgi:hypothetical protein